jgi:hypothetical protein
MKVYLAEHPGKTNKDAMKHVCLPILSTFLIPHQVFRSGRFGKMHRKIQSAARKLRRRIPKLLQGRRKLQQRSPRVRVHRLSLAATNERSRSHDPAFDQFYSLRRFGPFGIIVYFSPGFRLVFYPVFMPIVLLLCFLQRDDGRPVLTLLTCRQVVIVVHWHSTVLRVSIHAPDAIFILAMMRTPCSHSLASMGISGVSEIVKAYNFGPNGHK